MIVKHDYNLIIIKILKKNSDIAKKIKEYPNLRFFQVINNKTCKQIRISQKN